MPEEAISHVAKMLICDTQWYYLRRPSPLSPVQGKDRSNIFLRAVEVFHLS